MKIVILFFFLKDGLGYFGFWDRKEWKGRMLGIGYIVLIFLKD